VTRSRQTTFDRATFSGENTSFNGADFSGEITSFEEADFGKAGLALSVRGCGTQPLSSTGFLKTEGATLKPANVEPQNSPPVERTGRPDRQDTLIGPQS
jgi:uncharacterized protein YjbI with pentapeptide repeats